jgi:thiol-disulfide isomerase/thioredoxin
MNTPRSLLLLALMMLPTAGLVRAAAEKSAIEFRSMDFDAATQVAAKEEKIVFIDFYTTWCGPCKLLDALTWTDAAVGKLVNAKAVALKLDAEKEGKGIAQRYNVSAYPTLLLLKPDGTIVDRLVGFREPAMFIAEFQAALDGRPSLVRAQAAVAKAAQNGSITHEMVEARYKLAQGESRAGNRAAALADFLWCFDEGMIAVRSYAGVRLSFLLGEIDRLGTKEARAALLERRDAAEQRMLADFADRQAATDFAALTVTVKDTDRMVAVFDMMPPGDPRRSSMGHRLYQRFIELKRYPDAVEVMRYEQLKAQFESFQSMPNPKGDARLEEAHRRLVITTALNAIEALAGAEQISFAQEFRDALLKYDYTDATIKALKERLQRAGHPELAPK